MRGESCIYNLNLLRKERKKTETIFLLIELDAITNRLMNALHVLQLQLVLCAAVGHRTAHLLHYAPPSRSPPFIIPWEIVLCFALGIDGSVVYGNLFWLFEESVAIL